MELNREQVIAELLKNDSCYAEDIKAIQNAIALINSQEQKILELENRLKECENGYEGTLFLDRCKLHDAEEKVKELTEGNERLHTSCTELTQCCTKLETLYKIECKRVDTVKADTVRKMQSEIKERCINGGIYPAFVASTIVQIANEMLEGDADGKTD